MNHRFVQIHSLCSYPAALLNRDDVGFAKRIPFGGATRTRISSQCLKRHWRTFDGEHSLAELDLPRSIRSRLTFERFVYEPLVKEDHLDEKLARAITEALIAEVLGESAKAKKAKGEREAAATDPATADKEEGGGLRTGQVTVLGRPEVDYLLKVARSLRGKVTTPADAAKAVKGLDRELKKNLQALRHAAGLDAALFGRMVTSDSLARGDAAIHVAHAFTVHAESAETDYFSAVDDLLAEGDEGPGSGHINTAELTSGLYYNYVVVDLPLLVSNLEGCTRQAWVQADRSLAAEVVSRLIQLVATVSPGAKLGSTAPYSYAHLLAVEVGNSQPRTLANAFLAPVADKTDLLGHSYRRLAEHLRQLDRMYGRTTERALAALGPAEILEAVLGAPGSLSDVARLVGERVRA